MRFLRQLTSRNNTLEKKIIITHIFLLTCSIALSQSKPKTVVDGIITDSKTGEGLVAVTVLLNGTYSGCLSDEAGRFTFEVDEIINVDSITVSYTGYYPQVHAIEKGKVNTFHICMQVLTLDLEEVTVIGKRKRYEKKGNPAHELALRLIEKNKQNNRAKKELKYGYERYEKITFSVNNFKTPKAKRFQFLNDLAEIDPETGKTNLPLSIKERVINTQFINSNKKEFTIAKRSKGVDDKFSQDNIETQLSNIIGEIDLYDDEITFATRKFTSPVASYAATYYRYYLSPDTLNIDGQRYVELIFTPRNKEAHNFRGTMTVAADSSLFIHKVEISLMDNYININFIHNLSVSLTYKKGINDLPFLDTDILKFDYKLISEDSDGLRVSRMNSYQKYSYFDTAPEPLVAKGQVEIDDELSWCALRHTPLQPSEARADSVVSGLRQIPLYKIAEWGAVVAEQGFAPLGKKKLIDIGPLYSIVTSNALDGYRLGVGFATTPELMKHLQISTFAGYGFTDHKVKYRFSAEYSFNKSNKTFREFPVHSIRAMYSFDTYRPGDVIGDYEFTNTFAQVLKRRTDNTIYYMRNIQLTYLREFKSGFSYQLLARRYEAEDSKIWRFTPDNLMNSFNISECNLYLRYSPSPKIYQSKIRRRVVDRYLPIYELSHTTSFKGFLGGAFSRNYTQASITKRFNLFTLGFVDSKLTRSAGRKRRDLCRKRFWC